MQGMLLMLFMYWGWDTTVSLNEESEEPDRIPGTAGVISTVILLFTFLLVILSVESFAGIGTHGIGLGNPNNQNDVLSVLGSAIFGGSGIGQVAARLLVLMVLTSTAATAQTTILPNARTTLSMSFHKALPDCSPDPPQIPVAHRVDRGVQRPVDRLLRDHELRVGRQRDQRLGVGRDVLHRPVPRDHRCRLRMALPALDAGRPPARCGPRGSCRD